MARLMRAAIRMQFARWVYIRCLVSYRAMEGKTVAVQLQLTTLVANLHISLNFAFTTYFFPTGSKSRQSRMSSTSYLLRGVRLPLSSPYWPTAPCNAGRSSYFAAPVLCKLGADGALAQLPFQGGKWLQTIASRPVRRGSWKPAGGPVAAKSVAASSDTVNDVSYTGKEGLCSVIIPTYNRLPILQKCLLALEKQVLLPDGLIRDYEVILVDDGSSDDTIHWVRAQKQAGGLAHVVLLEQAHAGATRARNLGMRASRGSTIVFIDSDMVVCPAFLAEHDKALTAARARDGDDRAFSYGAVVNTSNFEHPELEPYKLTDYSAAFFATGNVAIARRRLVDAARAIRGPARSHDGAGVPDGSDTGGDQLDGPFDADFSSYGWEDLELGERLRQQGATIVQCRAAVGYHYHPAFSLDQLPALIEQERQRGRNGVRFFQKHPSLNVRLMIQMTPFHYGLWALLTLWGLINEDLLRPLLQAAVAAGRPGLAAGLLSPILNWHCVQAVYEEARRRSVK
eukprot:jgi/Mesvir1/2403/Mv22145-RA.1